MQRAMARQAEAERERRAKVINAEGEYQAAERLRTPRVIAEQPMRSSSATSRRCSRSARTNSSTIVFPVPIELLRALHERTGFDRVAAGTPKDG